MDKQTMVKKNQVYTVTIEDLTYEGMGVAKIDGYPLFIENTLPGEEVEIQVLKVGKHFGFAKVKEMKKRAANRVDVADLMLIRTGIAPLAHMTYAAQLAFKQQQVESNFHRIGRFETVDVLPVIGMDEPTHYRNKAQIPVRQVNGELATGFFRKNSHDLVPMEDFFIQEKEIDEAVKVVRDVMRRFGVKAYNESDNTGNLRHIIVRKGHYSQEMMIVLVTRKAKLFRNKEIVEHIIDQLPHVVSIIQNINPDKTNVILGKESVVLYGKNHITDQLLGKTYQISDHSFYQVNSLQAEVLYQTAMDFAELKPTDVVIDAYCGIGTIALSLADQVKQVYGVEVIPQAIEDAKINAELNQIHNATFVVGKAEDVLVEWKKEGVQADVLIVDPPRKGLAPEFVEAAIEAAPKKVIYVSCNPATLARDCRLLVDGGYQLEKVQPVDLFPYTAHVECVALMSRVEK